MLVRDMESLFDPRGNTFQPLTRLVVFCRAVELVEETLIDDSDTAWRLSFFSRARQRGGAESSQLWGSRPVLAWLDLDRRSIWWVAFPSFAILECMDF